MYTLGSGRRVQGYIYIYSFEQQHHFPTESSVAVYVAFSFPKPDTSCNSPISIHDGTYINTDR